MAAGNSNFNDLYSVYVDEYIPGLRDNYKKQSKLWDHMTSLRGVRKDTGGVTLTEGIEYSMNGQYIRYTGADSWGTLPSNPFLTRAQYLRRQAAATIVATRTEELAKTDAVTNEDEIARKVMNAGKTIANGLCGDLYSKGDPALLQMDGLQKLIADSTEQALQTDVGGIDPSDPLNAWWKNYTANILATDSVIDAMEDAFLGTSRNNDRVDYIVADNGLFKRYFSALQAQQRFVDTSKASGGFMELDFNGIPVVFDQAMTNDMGGEIPTKHMYFINTDSIFVRPHVDCEMKKREKVNSFNSDVYSTAILWAGATTCNGRAFNGVIVTA